MKQIAVIGAGWAGLAAAAALAPQHRVTLFEASRVAGGRARSVAAAGFSFADNGQHLLLGAYEAVFALLEKAGADVRRHTRRQPLQWHLADGVRFQAAAWLPAPFNLLWAVLGAQGCTLRQKTALLRQLSALKTYQRSTLPDQSVASWLDAQGADDFWRRQFWLPMTAGALNTPLQHASLRVLADVLADGVWARKSGSDYCLPRIGLTEWFAEPVLNHIRAHGGRWQPETRVARLVCAGGGVWVNGERFDAAVAAVAPYHLDKLLPEHLGGGVRAALNGLRYHAITTVYLRYAAPLALPALMTGLAEGTAQWLIDRRRLNGANEVAAVISLSDTLMLSGSPNSAESWADAVHRDVLRLCPDAGEPVARQVITEKRATAACTPNRTLPDCADLNAAGIWLAGDWLHPRYPATLEAAVLSGQEAAGRL